MPGDYWDVDDPDAKTSRGAFAAGGGGSGVGGGPPGGGGGGGTAAFATAPSYAPPISQGTPVLRRLQSYMQSYQGGGPVSGGPPGVDTVDASLNNGEGVLTTRAMSFPGVMQLVNVLNAIAALGGDPTAPAGAGMPPGGTPGGDMTPGGGNPPGLDPAGNPYDMAQGDPDQDGYGLGGLIRGIPVVGGPLADVVSKVGPFALQALGVPLPIGAGLTSLAMEGDASRPLASLGNAVKAGGETALGAHELAGNIHIPGPADSAGPTDWQAFANGGRVSVKQPSSMIYPPDPDPSGTTRMSWAQVKSLWDPRSDESAVDWLTPSPGDTSDVRTGRSTPKTTKKPRYAYGGYVGPSGMAGNNVVTGAPGGTPPRVPPTPGTSNLPQPPTFDPGGSGLSPDDFGKMFNPAGNQFALSSAKANLTQQNYANDRADASQLQSLGLQDPNLAASFLSGQHQSRATAQAGAMAGVAADQANRSADFYGGIAKEDYAQNWQNYLDWINNERAKQLKQTKGK